jgi:limonene-1,2-epoxide hydrolase
VTLRAIALLAALALLPVAGCGSSDSGETTTVAGNADPDAVTVIRQWSDALRAGDIDAASDRFAIPSFVQNGSPLFELSSRRQVETFNQSLPCGARLTAASRSGRYTIATFVLTERPGPGQCGKGVGEAAKTAFVIQDGHIREWRRVVDAEPTGPTRTGPVI